MNRLRRTSQRDATWLGCWIGGKKKMDFIGGKIEQLASDLSGGHWGNLSDLSAEQIALRIEQWFLENKHEDTD